MANILGSSKENIKIGGFEDLAVFFFDNLGNQSKSETDEILGSPKGKKTYSVKV